MKPLDPRLLRTAAAARTYVLAAAALSAGATLCIIATAFAIGHALGPAASGMLASLSAADALAEVRGPLLLLACVVTARALLTFARERLGASSAVAVVGQLRRRLLDHAARLPHRWRASHGDEVAVLATRGLDDVVPYVNGYLPQLLMTAILTPVALAVMLWLDLISGLIVAVTLPLVPLFMWLVGVTTQQYSAKRLEALARQGAQLLDLLAGLTTLRGLGREIGPGTRVRKLADGYRTTTMQTLRVAFLSGAVLELLASLSVALVAVEIGMRLVYGRIDLVTALVVLVLAPEIYQPLRQVGAQFHASTNGLTAVQQVFRVLDTPVPATGTTPVPAWSAIRIRGARVAASERGYLAPEDLSALVRPGQVTALAGPSGAGKTTTAMALLLLQPLDAGSIELVTGVDGGARTGQDGNDDEPAGSVPLTDLDPSAWWAQCAWVPQRIVTSGGTVRTHVSAGQEVAQADLEAAARATGLDAVVAALPAGGDTPLAQSAGGLSSGLSVGQTHRLELTRALVRGARLVVLDEPTAHLAPSDEAQIVAAMRALAERGAAVVVIAHRPATIAAADQVVRVRAGQAREEAEDTAPAVAT